MKYYIVKAFCDDDGYNSTDFCSFSIDQKQLKKLAKTVGRDKKIFYVSMLVDAGFTDGNNEGYDDLPHIMRTECEVAKIWDNSFSIYAYHKYAGTELSTDLIYLDLKDVPFIETDDNKDVENVLKYLLDNELSNYSKDEDIMEWVEKWNNSK